MAVLKERKWNVERKRRTCVGVSILVDRKRKEHIVQYCSINILIKEIYNLQSLQEDSELFYENLQAVLKEGKH